MFSALTSKPCCCLSLPFSVETNASLKKGNAVNINFPELKKGCSGFWEGCLRFSSPPEKKDEELFVFPLAAIETAIERMNKKKTSKGISLAITTNFSRLPEIFEQIMQTSIPILGSSATALEKSGIGEKKEEIAFEALTNIMNHQDNSAIGLLSAKLMASMQGSCMCTTVATDRMPKTTPMEIGNDDLMVFSTGEGNRSVEFIDAIHEVSLKKNISDEMHDLADIEQKIISGLGKQNLQMEKYNEKTELFLETINLGYSIRVKNLLRRLEGLGSAIAIEYTFGSHFAFFAKNKASLKKATEVLKNENKNHWKWKAIASQ